MNRLTWRKTGANLHPAGTAALPGRPSAAEPGSDLSDGVLIILERIDLDPGPPAGQDHAERASPGPLPLPQISSNPFSK